MIKGDCDFLKELAKHNVCAKCKTSLEVAWHGGEDSYVLGCGNCGYIDAITRRLTGNQEYKAGAPTPEEYLDRELGERRRGKLSQDKQVIPFELEGVPGHDLATGEVLSKERMLALVEYARKYSLDPMRGHVVLMYGKPYITIDGYLYHAAQSRVSYTLRSRPMGTDELKEYKVGEFDYAWIAEAVFMESGASFTGVGIVTHDEMTEESVKKPGQLRSPVVAKHPWQLGQKRAEWQALRRAFPIGEEA